MTSKKSFLKDLTDGIIFRKPNGLRHLFLCRGYLLSSQGDRMAMANSVEGRYPFLDYRVIEFCNKLAIRF